MVIFQEFNMYYIHTLLALINTFSYILLLHTF